MKRMKLGKVGQLEFETDISALIGLSLLWAFFSWGATRLLKIHRREALVGGLLATLLHIFSTIGHHMGHARAATVTGFPMQGIRFWGVLATSVYPEDEPTLPATIHIQRAVGGPLASATLSLFAGLLVVITRPLGYFLQVLASFFFLDNLLAFTLGALMPLGFTDGGTILYWLLQRGRPNLVIE